MIIFDAFDKLITEHGSATIMRERLALIREQMQTLEKQVAELQQENIGLKEQISKLKSRLESRPALEEFVEFRGALFKRKAVGGFHYAVYCPDCHGPMMSLMDELPFNCHKCKRAVGFRGQDLREGMRDLQ